MLKRVFVVALLLAAGVLAFHQLRTVRANASRHNPSATRVPEASTSTTPSATPKGAEDPGRWQAPSAAEIAPPSTDELAKHPQIGRLFQALLHAQAVAQERRATRTTEADVETATTQTARKIWSPERDSIQAAIRERFPDIVQCLEPWVNLNPQTGGQITTRFVIGQADANAETASITDAAVAGGTLGNVFLEGCIVSVLSDLRFSPPERGGNVEVVHRLQFSTGDEPGAERD